MKPRLDQLSRTQIPRAQIAAEQAAWEAERAEREVWIEAREGGRFRLHGADIGNFRDLVGPEKYYRFQAAVGNRISIEPTSWEQAKNCARNLVRRIVSVC